MDKMSFNLATDMTVIGACEWEIQATRLENRIPFQISEVMCRSRSASCGGNPFYRVSKKNLKYH